MTRRGRCGHAFAGAFVALFVTATLSCGSGLDATPPGSGTGAHAAHGATPCAGPAKCGADGRSIVRSCGGQTEIAQACLGPGGCTMGAAGAICDESIARPGDGCRFEGSFGCTPDTNAMTVCRGGKVAVASTCKGPRKCSIASGVACDTSIVDARDPCSSEGKMGCSRDGHVLFKCTGGAFVEGETCKRQACLIGGGKVICR